MKKIILLGALIFSGLGYAQSSDINDYKYVVIPEKFEFLKEKNEYNLNTLTKMIFEKKGFEVYYTNDELPFEAKMDKCKVLYGDLINNSGLLSTTMTLVLNDCNGKAVFTSLEGKSKEKEFRRAYYEALREASRSVEAMIYKYKSGTVTEAGTSSSDTQTETTTQNRDNQLYARKTANGYELLDKTQKVVLKMFKTSQPNSYSAQMEGVNGVVFKKDGEWIFEYYLNDKMVTQKLNIKF